MLDDSVTTKFEFQNFHMTKWLKIDDEEFTNLIK